MISLFSTASARDALTSLMRPSLSAASGSRIWERIEARASASLFLHAVRAGVTRRGDKLTAARLAACRFLHRPTAIAALDVALV